MINPVRAAVKPRVLLAGSEALPLEDEILSLIEAGKTGEVRLLGDAGSGKTTALQHLAAVLPTGAAVLLDEADHPMAELHALGHLTVCVLSRKPPETAAAATFWLAPWGRDEVIEYLCAMHKERCAGVLARLKPEDFSRLGGSPDLWRIILDQLATDPALASARTALHCYLQAQLQDTDLLQRARSKCLNSLVAANENKKEAKLEKQSWPGMPTEIVRVLRHQEVQLLLAAERIAIDLRSEAACDFLKLRLPRELIEAAVCEIKGEAQVRSRLEGFVAGPDWSHAMAASLLHAAFAPWVPALGSLPKLAGAYLDGVHWLGVQLPAADLSEASLTNANLQGAHLQHANISSACFRSADLHGACLDQVKAERTDFGHANLSSVRAREARFVEANLEGAEFDDAFLKDASFRNGKLAGATFRRANLVNAVFLEAILTEADFSEADLSGAILEGLKLSQSIFNAARFTRAHLRKCDLEYLELGPADFETANLHGALLTGTHAPRANFRAADLGETGLAEIDWEGACLCGADLRGASFHMGTTRSGLVGSPLASEGTRTGFYTDDYDDRYFKSPEEIRKANLRSADLRGARIDAVDFYLVDLRDAFYTPGQEACFRRCGAILQ
ncbi:MAG TPA: pentapeptide repeat-containing protein [Gemmataceae bacterium]|jgi:uncharacterized protein YjbI with pentapeptide repeats|nr:pentapeptide repeat-containing protein [Gemmataceae bacterium]